LYKTSFKETVKVVKLAARSLIRGGYSVENIFLIHDEEFKEKINSSVGDEWYKQVEVYYGSQIALYYGWVAFYTDHLKSLAAFGLISIINDRLKNKYPWIVPFFFISISVWSTFLVEFWKRRNSSLAYSWNIFDADQESETKDIAKVSFGCF